MTTRPHDRPVVETTLRVRYAETDAMAVVYHTNYLIWFEVGRGEYSRAIGADYRQWEDNGLFLPVVDLSCRYLSPARYGDMVVIATWVDEVRSRGLTFAYEARLQEDDRVLATGRTVHVCIDRSGRAVQIPAEWRAKMSEKH